MNVRIKELAIAVIALSVCGIIKKMLYEIYDIDKHVLIH